MWLNQTENTDVLLGFPHTCSLVRSIHLDSDDGAVHKTGMGLTADGLVPNGRVGMSQIPATQGTYFVPALAEINCEDIATILLQNGTWRVN